MLKKQLFALLLTGVALAAQANETPFESFTGKIVGSKVRMRTQPNLDSHVVSETRVGQLFAVTGEEGEYYAVQPKPEIKGYVFRTFVLDGVVEGDRVNVRLYPDIEAPVVAQLNRGDKIHSTVSAINNKWLEVDLPQSSHFYIAKEYIEKLGPVDMIATLENRHREATHHLSSAFLFAQAQIQKPFEQIDLDAINQKFSNITKEYHDISDIRERAQEANAVMQDIFIQKKIAFLESKAAHHPVNVHIDQTHLDKLAALGIEIKPYYEEREATEIAQAASMTLGLATTLGSDEITDKMLIWQPLEESLFHLWAVANGEQTIREFYNQEEREATQLTGIIEPYNRPVKNRPGDYLLRCDNLPVAFLYSTRVNLDKLVGKRVTVMASPRPNNHFAFPAYFVLSVN